MATVFVVGSHGQTGQEIVKELVEAGYNVRGLVRNQKQAETVKRLGADTFIGELGGVFTHGLEDADIVICAVGAGRSGSPEEVDHVGTVRLIEQSVLEGVSRFILISSIGTLDPDHMPPLLRPYLLAKRQAEKVLEESHLNYTIIRPGGLTNEPATGKVTAAVGSGLTGIISRADVAKATLLSLSISQTEETAFELISGDLSIEEALRSLK